MPLPHHSLFDQLIINFDQALRTLVAQPSLTSQRPNPADQVAEANLSHQERQTALCLLRVDHAGEVCAQALYQGQALTAVTPALQDKLQQAAAEEVDHLAWCQQRINELGGHASYLNFLWYIGSFAIGAAAGYCGD